MIDKWYEGLYPNLNYFYLIVPYSNEYCVHYTMLKHVDWANKGKIDDISPSNYKEFLSFKGVGPSTVRIEHYG